MRIEGAIMGSLTFVDAVKSSDGEQFFINDTDNSITTGNVTGPLTEAEFREEFTRRGLSAPEIEERVTTARRPKSRP